MGIDLNNGFEDLRQHIGHKIACVRYGKGDECRNVALECETCGTVLIDFDRPFSLVEEEDHEDDNIKIFHSITSPDGERHFIDHSPYERISEEALEKYTEYYKAFGRFPSRNDIRSRGPLNNEEVIGLLKSMEG
jgi:hypothetical protein